jgi:hypothetical protein
VTTSTLHAALRARAHGLYSAEAGVELLIGHGEFLRRNDFRDRFAQIGTSATDGITAMAEINWPPAIAALDTGDLPCSSGEQRMLRLAASLAGGIPVDLSDALSGLDDRNIALTVAAILHACGRRPQPPATP